MTIYQVSEDDGVVEVCAVVYSQNVTCPIEFAFNVTLSTSDGIAGIHYKHHNLKYWYFRIQTHPHHTV